MRVAAFSGKVPLLLGAVYNNSCVCTKPFLNKGIKPGIQLNSIYTKAYPGSKNMTLHVYVVCCGYYFSTMLYIILRSMCICPQLQLFKVNNVQCTWGDEYIHAVYFFYDCMVV